MEPVLQVVFAFLFRRDPRKPRPRAMGRWDGTDHTTQKLLRLDCNSTKAAEVPWHGNARFFCFCFDVFFRRR